MGEIGVHNSMPVMFAKFPYNRICILEYMQNIYKICCESVQFMAAIKLILGGFVLYIYPHISRSLLSRWSNHGEAEWRIYASVN